MTGEKYATIENLSSGIAIIWGIVLLNPYVASFERNPVLFAPMRQIINTEWIWGSIFLALGLLCLFLCFHGRKISAALVLFIFFGFISVLFAVGDITSQAFAIYGLIAVFNLMHWRASHWTRYRNG
jgi:hypothetical protein